MQRFAIALGFNGATHLRLIHVAGFRLDRKRSPLDVTPVTPLDAPACVAYVGVFLLMLLLGARRPGLGVASLIAIDPFSLYRNVGSVTIALPKTALIGILAGLLLRRPNLQALFEYPTRAVLFAALSIVAATSLSIIQAEHLPEALRETLKSLEYLAVFVAVTLAMRDDPDERSVRIALAFTVILVAGAALSQLPAGAPSVLLYAGRPIPRIAGPLEGPNQLSGYLGVTLPILTAFALAKKALRMERIALAMGVIALFLTFSRAGVLTSLAAIALVIALAPADRRKSISLLISTASLAGMGLIVMLGELIAHDYKLLWRFVSFSESSVPGSVGTRSELWHAAVSLWRMHPWLGIGAGNFELEISKVGPSGIKTHANSLYLQSLVEGGLPLLSAQLYAAYASMLPFARASLKSPLVLGALAASAGLALHQAVDLLVFYPKVGAMWWIALGLAASASEVPGSHVKLCTLRAETKAEPGP